MAYRIVIISVGSIIMKKVLKIFVLLVMILSTACGSKKVATKTSNTTSKSVDQVLQEKTGNSQNSDDKNHGGSVTNPDDTSNKKSASSQVPIAFNQNRLEMLNLH